MLKRARPQDQRNPEKGTKLVHFVHTFETGTGETETPFTLPLRESANRDGCFHCTEKRCCCRFFDESLQKCYASLAVQRKVEFGSRRDLCAKSVLPQFVSRLVRIAKVNPSATFFDFGCGNGSVVFQVAFMTGAPCVGIEINPQNAEVARQAWDALRPGLERKCGRQLHVQIICGDFCKLLQEEAFLRSFLAKPSIVWAANLLLPRATNHYLSERFRSVPQGTQIFCFEDLYPHSRSLARIRDPDAFDKFEMRDFVWQRESVEWCNSEGRFYMYVRK